ncbi:MAG: alpha-N-acetylglucosaminidase [Prevotella sp.]|nr:alpha-N-acetylglucosaminidase [Prevotella sp.]
MRSLLSTLVCVVCMGMQATPIDQLLERIDKGASSKFRIELKKSDRDFFELDQRGSRPVVRGNSWVNIGVGINWYLKYYAGIQLTWNQMTATLPDVLPPVTKRERHETDLTLRYDFNYCTFSYSMPFWDWQRWQQEIDWMALHGVNMPLAVVGEECVWRNMLLRLGYSEQEIGRFIAGPAFLAWWAMNNLEGWGGPLPQSWYQRQEQLQKQILQRMKELGMHPVLPGYCGMVPHDARERLGLNVSDAGLWNGFQRPANLVPTDSRFEEIAALYYEELTKLFGKADYYSMDPFHESSDDATIDYAESGRQLMAAMKRVNPKAIWVVQGWTENPRPAMADALEQGHLLVLDLFSECRPMFGAPSIWNRPEGYGKHQWLFCLLENFGANVGLHGRMDQLLDNFYFMRGESTASLKNCKGIGFTMEGSENNPVMFELMSELPWRPEKFAKEEWLRSYVRARYGADDRSIGEAWQLLGRTIYNCPMGNNQQGPHESIFCGRPSLNNFQASSWSKMKNYYDPASTLRAAQLFLYGAQRLHTSSTADRSAASNLKYDLVDITRQALADQARLQYQHVIADYKSFAIDDFVHSSSRFLQMLLLQDELLATRTEFRLGHWIEPALRCATNDSERRLYEWNARVQITTWGNRYCADTGGLRDYAHKEWQGLLRDFYYVRWKAYFDALLAQMKKLTGPQPELLSGGPNANKTSSELFAMALPQEVKIDWYAMEEPWTLQQNSYAAQPEGDAFEVAAKVLRFLTEKQ